MVCLFRSAWIRGSIYQKNIFDTEGKVKNECKEKYEKLKEVIDFDSKSLVPLKNFLERSVENNQK
ncbi:hypothetical protein JP0099_00850 [Helicobacter pylori]|nr:hypothetical protein OHP005_04880 [Helicobacter pylori]GHR48142.1 hypothetical protein JP0099_00850 [Helicobacter pylori]